LVDEFKENYSVSQDNYDEYYSYDDEDEYRDDDIMLPLPPPSKKEEAEKNLKNLPTAKIGVIKQV